MRVFYELEQVGACIDPNAGHPAALTSHTIGQHSVFTFI